MEDTKKALKELHEKVDMLDKKINLIMESLKIPLPKLEYEGKGASIGVGIKGFDKNF